MKIYKIAFTRPNQTVAFPSMIDSALAAHVVETYMQCDPIKLVVVSTDISDDLLTLTLTRTFATDADALEFSTDAQFVAWLAAHESELAASGITRTAGLSE